MGNESLKIEILTANKSIQPMPAFDLPEFTVLTGANGSGKSHLFELMAVKENSNIIYKGNKITKIHYIAFNQLNPKIDAQCNPKTITEIINQLIQNLNEAKSGIIRPNNKLSISQIENKDIQKRLDNNTNEILTFISKKANKPIAQLTEENFIEHYPFKNSKNEIYNGKFALIFKSYHVRKIDNLLNKVYTELGDSTPYLSDEEFVEKYGDPPWDFVNSILQRLHIPYTVNNPDKTRRETTFKFELHDPVQKIAIQPNDLSTGEKTLMSLALAIYNTENDMDKVELLILDEPDAALHPSMSKLMIEILYEDICKNKGIPVIISTHSPATVACTPATSLFKISKDNHKPQPCSLEDSIGMLATGIPNFRVSVEDRRQVFVEGKYDVEYYEKLFNILSRVESFPTKPQFLPPHTREGTNCSDVEKIVSAMTAAGNDLVYGLIDSDRKKHSKENIIVLGNGNRYAIENYLFEPHLLGLYLIKKCFQSPADLGFNEYSSYIEYTQHISQNILQRLSNEISEFLLPKTPYLCINSQLHNGFSIQVPEILTTMNGHELENKIKETWPRLKSIRKNRDSSIKIDLIDSIINDFPNLISEDIFFTFKQFT